MPETDSIVLSYARFLVARIANCSQNVSPGERGELLLASDAISHVLEPDARGYFEAGQIAVRREQARQASKAELHDQRETTDA